MRDLCQRHDAARRTMIDAFREMSDAAAQAGVDWDRITALHGRFFDGNEDVKVTFGTAAILAWLYCDEP